MKIPIIGVPLMGTSMPRRYMQSKYTQCLRKAGADVRILKPDLFFIKQYIHECNGFLFPGGADISPSLYGASPTKECGRPNSVRDTFETALLHAVLEIQKPVLCICRGMQLLNVVQGGTLHQDIRKLQTYPHQDLFHKNNVTHPILLAENSRLESIFMQQEIKVNSLHHQAVAKIGKNLIATAFSPEGFVEALEDNTRDTFVMGVQWHPEHMAAKHPAQQRLFESLLEACKSDGVSSLACK